MKHSVEFKAFDSLVRDIITFPRAELLKREAEYKKRAALNPQKRGPKKKRKSGDLAPADQPPS